MADIATAYVNLQVSTRDIAKGVRSEFGQVEREAARTGDVSGRNLLSGIAGKGGLGGIGNIAAKAMGVATKAVAVGAASMAAAAGAGMVKMVGMAGRAEQSIGGVGSVFGAQASIIERESQRAADAFGLSAVAYQELATTMGSTLKNKGVKDYTEQTRILVALGGDLAATFGGDASTAVEALSSALRGETDPIERYGVSINEAAVKAKMLSMGLTETEGAAGEAAKTQARLALIMEQTAAAQGQAGREHDTYASTLERVKAKAQNAAVELGEKLLPAATDVMLAFEGQIPTLQSWADKGVSAVNQFVAGLTGSGGEEELGYWGDRGEEFRGQLDSISDWWETDGDQVIADVKTLAGALQLIVDTAGKLPGWLNGGTPVAEQGPQVPGEGGMPRAAGERQGQSGWTTVDRGWLTPLLGDKQLSPSQANDAFLQDWEDFRRRIENIDRYFYDWHPTNVGEKTRLWIDTKLQPWYDQADENVKSWWEKIRKGGVEGANGLGADADVRFAGMSANADGHMSTLRDNVNLRLSETRDWGNTRLTEARDWWSTRLSEARDTSGTRLSELRDTANTRLAETRDWGNTRLTEARDWWGTRLAEARDGGSWSMQSLRDSINLRLSEARDWGNTRLTEARDWWSTRMREAENNGAWSMQSLRDRATSWLTILRDEGANLAGQLRDRMGDAFAGIVDKFRGPVQTLIDFLNRHLVGGVNRIAEKVGLGTKWLPDIPPIGGMADGGILSRDPQIRDRPVLWAEAGPEAYIPLDPAKRKRSLSLWREVGRQLGADTLANGRVFPLPAGTYRQTQGVHGADRGYDYGVPVGTPVMANADATVVQSRDLGGRSYGKYVRLSNGSVYAHLSQLLVSAGQNVSAGQRIGLSGNTGNSTGPHLHYVPAGSLGASVMSGMLDIAALFKSTLGDVSGKARAALGSSQWGQMLARIPGTLATSALKTLQEKAASFMDAGLSGGASRWMPVVLEALRRVGQPASMAGAVLRQIQEESGGNPLARNLWDVNAKRGDPSVGLLQVIGSTFSQYRDRSLPNDRTDPLANITAALRYVLDRYGSISVFDRVKGYQAGTRSAAPGWAWVGERGPELMRMRGGEKILDAGTSASVPGGLSARDVARAVRDGLNAADVYVVRRNDYSLMGAGL